MTTVLSADWVLPIDGEPIEHGAIAIEDGRVAAVGTISEVGEGTHYDDAVILPGFVNAHSHLEYAVYGGFGDGLDFADWIIVHTERKGRVGYAEMEASAFVGAAECLRSGITTVADASFCGAAAVACDALGLRAIVYLEVFGRELTERFQENRERVEPHLSERLQLGISPHAPYTVAPELYAACLELGLPVATHLNESTAELRWLRDGTGPWERFGDILPPPPGESGIRFLARHGLLDRRLVAAHCVKVDAEEIALLAEHDVAIAHCPRSNAVLGCGIAPLRELRSAGLRVGLGTDSPASTPSFDMFEELRAAVYAARARAEDPAALSATSALELATLGSARALRIEVDVGSLAPGKYADVQVVSLSGSQWLPWEDPAAAVVFGGSPDRVVATYVGGDLRYEKGGNQWHELTAAAHNARRAMLAHAAHDVLAGAAAPPPRAS